jgi:putative ABC transport system ATP-binding protein
MAIIVQASGLTRQVQSGGQPLVILDEINFAVEQGASLAILGASGSGKSTLLGLLAGLDTPSAGTVHLDGTDIFALDEDERARLRGRLAGFVFQSFQLLPALTALENVMLPLELRALPDARERAAEALQRVGLAARMTHLPKHLSGGEQQRVAMARAFVTQPKILFADEPTGNLDAATGAQIIDLLMALNEQQRTTLILVTHDAALAERCGRQLRLVAGRVSPSPFCAPPPLQGEKSRLPPLQGEGGGGDGGHHHPPKKASPT